jgi:hypothetical protein
MTINLRRRFTPIGLVVFGGFVLVMVLGYATRQLFPESAIGSFLNSVGGLLLAFAAASLTGDGRMRCARFVRPSVLCERGGAA